MNVDVTQPRPSRYEQPFTLFHHPYSICSIMVRFTFALGASVCDAADVLKINEEALDIFHGAQLTEQFLCDINPKGQVPVLVNTTVLSTPIADSLDISLYACRQYPNLLPTAQEKQIMHLLHQLHDINTFSLTFSNKPAAAAVMKQAVLDLLAKPDLPLRYENALNFKLQVVEDEKVAGLVPEAVEKETMKAKVLLSHIDTMLSTATSDLPHQWIFGGTSPTVVDAHLVPFLARLRDVGKGGMIPLRVTQYADMAMASTEWCDMMGGRKTVPSQG